MDFLCVQFHSAIKHILQLLGYSLLIQVSTAASNSAILFS